MSWDEWEQLKANAAARGSTRVRLNHAPDTVGVGYDHLKSHKRAWAKAGADLAGLKDDISKALGKLDDGQPGLGDTVGSESAVAQKKLFASWKKYVGDVSGRCDELAGLLERTGIDLAMSDADVKAELDKIRSKYQDTDVLGGRAKDK